MPLSPKFFRHYGVCLVAGFSLSACSTVSNLTAQTGQSLRNLFAPNAISETPSTKTTSLPSSADYDCPSVSIIDGGSTIRSYAGRSETSQLRHQISIGQTARECHIQHNGSVKVRVGVEGRAILGPGGSPRKFEVPVTILLKRDERIIVQQNRRASVVIPSGDTLGTFILVEDGLILPDATQSFDIEVGLGTSTPFKKLRVR